MADSHTSPPLTRNSSSFFFLRSHLAPVDFTWAASASAHAAAFFAVSRPPRLPPTGGALLLCPHRRGAGGRVRIPSLRAKPFTLSRHPQSLRPQRALSRSRFAADTALKAALRVGSANAPTPSCGRCLPKAAPRVGRSKRFGMCLCLHAACCFCLLGDVRLQPELLAEFLSLRKTYMASDEDLAGGGRRKRRRGAA